MKRFLSLLITLLLGFIVYYIFLPAINLSSFAFWIFLVFLIFIYCFSNLFFCLDFKTDSIFKLGFDYKVLAGFVILVFGGIFLVDIVLSPIFSARSYHNRISVLESTEFVNDIDEVDFNSLPLIDKDSSQKLGDRVMGQLPDLVSQFYVSDIYTQINYNGNVIRVTPLEYDGVIKYFSNMKNGIPGYISVDSVSGEVKLVKLDSGMKYMPSALFGHDLYRKLRFSYPTKVFGDWSFEVDDEGNPYWIVPTIKYSGVGLKRDVNGVVILNPIDGSSDYYDISNVPTWVDNVYKADVILEQVNDWGKYKNGFINSIFGQKNVVATTEGYNYMAMNDDVYLYTGITSIVNDESNIGFILTNMRTKETSYYAVPGAEEYSAMASSEGQVQQMGYVSTFPLLINLNGRPTYLMSLKDNAGLVKMYSFVDVVDYQKVVVTDSSLGIREASRAYLSKMGFDDVNLDKLIIKDITIASISSYSIDGNSVFYITDTKEKRYSVNIGINSDVLPFLSVGDTVSVGYAKEEDVIKVLELKQLKKYRLFYLYFFDFLKSIEKSIPLTF